VSNAGIMVWGDLVTAVLHRVALASAGREVELSAGAKSFIKNWPAISENNVGRRGG
jgi:hypothetical protein